MLNSKLTLTKLIITVFLTLGLSISFQSLLAQWTPPTGSPPNNNASKLLQASSTSAGRQIMEDAFEVQNFLDVFSGFSADGDTLFVDQVNNRVGIGTTGPLGTLDIDGDLCISGDCISDWSGMGSGGAITYITSTYYDTCGGGTCDRTTDIGAHDFCALSRVGGPGGFNTLCRVFESAGSWNLIIRDGDAGQTHSCEAICFDSSGSGGSSGGGMPAGAVVSFPFDTCPSDWIPADGDAYTNGAYSDLETAIGAMYGDGTLDKDGNTVNLDYNVPDYRGRFLRGLDDGAGRDPDAASRNNRGDGTTGDAVGTRQGDEFEQHNHPFFGAMGAFDGVSRQLGWGVQQNIWSNTNIGDTGGSETRPKNINVLYCINTVEGGGAGGGGGLALGDWDTRAENINYLAATDGIVITRGSGVAHGWGYVSGYTDSSNPSTILRARNGSGYVDVGGGASIAMPVKSGDYWRVTRAGNIGALAVYWIPLNNSGGSSLWTAGAGDDIYHDSGNIGIGTNNPQNKLTVQAVAGERTLYLWNNASNPELALGDGVAGNHWAIYNDLASDDLFFWKDGANRMVITDNGNVGIGTDIPGAKLEVDGTAGYESIDDMGTADTDFASKKYVDDNAGGPPAGTVTGGCAYGSAWGTATVCGLGAGMACSAGHTARIIVYCNAVGCAWNGPGHYAHGFCIRD